MEKQDTCERVSITIESRAKEWCDGFERGYACGTREQGRANLYIILCCVVFLAAFRYRFYEL
jgi:hypothetical protein